MDDTDLSRLDLAGAREYILAFATDAKRYEREIEEARKELDLWTSRIALAEQKGMAELAAAAKAKAVEVGDKIAALKAEKTSLDSKIEAMKGQLPLIRGRERSVNADGLLAELELMTGSLLENDTAKTERDFAALEKSAKADSALDALKKKMAGQ